MRISLFKMCLYSFAWISGFVFLGDLVPSIEAVPVRFQRHAQEDSCVWILRWNGTIALDSDGGCLYISLCELINRCMLLLRVRTLNVLFFCVSDLSGSNSHDAAATDHIEATHPGSVQTWDRVYVFIYSTRFKKTKQKGIHKFWVTFVFMSVRFCSRWTGAEDQGETGSGKEENKPRDRGAERQT